MITLSMDSDASLTRREFVKLAAATTMGIGAGSLASAAASEGGMAYRTLGRTCERVSALGLGGYHIGKQADEQESIGLIRSAIDGGITFMDNCWDYHRGASEIRMGKALRDGYREKVFLMSKIDGRTKESATSQIDESLQRLQTDRIDLMQFHEIIRMEDPDRIFAEGGGIEAMQAAQQAGKIRYIGFTGHKDPLVHLRMLEIAANHKFRFDAVQMPLNVMDTHFRSFEQQVLPLLVKDDVGVLAMKAFADPFILRSNTVAPIECLHYVLEPAGLDSDHGHRLGSGSRARPPGCPHFRPAEQRSGGSAARPHSGRGRNRQIRALQDFKPTRRDRSKSAVARLTPKVTYVCWSVID